MAPIRLLMEHWSHDLWTRRLESTIDVLLAPECLIDVEGAEGSLGREAFRTYWRSFTCTFPDLQYEVLTSVAEGNVGAIHWQARGTHYGVGCGVFASVQKAEFTGVTVLHAEKGVVVRGFDRWNRGDVFHRIVRDRTLAAAQEAHLTPRQQDVAFMMAERLTYLEIAQRIGVKPNTARRHCEAVMNKLGVHEKQDVARALGGSSVTPWIASCAEPVGKHPRGIPSGIG
ncbi:LuxR family transcriptional regulator [Gemmatimonas aurantiaca T-27]|uniref:LuxR family transcriptional regulator n=2 Tax=Gemmatimonas aurantiaca TaxID=173480 RepID=C1AC02_GEMAT|nr:ester cyclase [Gemmatimonas aurantiaca]BAH40029.1 LuxR family transcriptional regulator [Gemmatimonas aurantiaca T-27]